jgi:hypothetical protein
MPNLPSAQIYSWQTLTPGWGGLNVSDLPFRLVDTQSPHMLNMWISDRILASRPGQEWESEALPADILSVYKRLYKGYIVFHAGDKLYRKAPGSMTADAIFTGVSTNKGSFYAFKGLLLYKNNPDYIEYDGTTARRVAGYAPVVRINGTPAGTGGDTAEAYNLYGAGFRNRFNGDGTSTDYKLTDAGLDSAPAVTALVGTQEITEGSGLTVNRQTGVVTFASAPAAGQNNVTITAYKTPAEDNAKIAGCRYMISYGGENNSRLFAAGNGSGEYYNFGALDHTYWPDTGYNSAGNKTDDITGFGEQYDTLIVFTSHETYGVKYENNEGKAMFPQYLINAESGCDCPWTIELVNNNLVWLNSQRGPMIMTSTVIEDEKNIVPIGRNINEGREGAGLLSEDLLVNAVSADVMGRYWIAVNGNAYLWDYSNFPYVNTGSIEADARAVAWFRFDNIHAAGFCEAPENVFYARGDAFVKFVDFKADFETTGINKIYRTPLRDFGIINYLKNILKIWVTVRADTNTKIMIIYISEQYPNGEAETEEINAYSFGWDKFTWDRFSWSVYNFAVTFRRKVKRKKVQRFAAEFRNAVAGSDMSIAEIKFDYTIAKQIKEG